jgi:hypothetical protein
VITRHFHIQSRISDTSYSDNDVKNIIWQGRAVAQTHAAVPETETADAKFDKSRYAAARCAAMI